MEWARLQVDANLRLRRGAWYRVASLSPGEVELDVNRDRVAVPRDSLKIISAVPQSWSVVARPRDAKGLPATWGDKYVVCPGCRTRAQLRGAPHQMRCPRCDQVFRVAWDEWLAGMG